LAARCAEPYHLREVSFQPGAVCCFAAVGPVDGVAEAGRARGAPGIGECRIHRMPRVSKPEPCAQGRTGRMTRDLRPYPAIPVSRW